MLDMVFDHYLTKYWDKYSEQSYAAGCGSYYHAHVGIRLNAIIYVASDTTCG